MTIRFTLSVETQTQCRTRPLGPVGSSLFRRSLNSQFAAAQWNSDGVHKLELPFQKVDFYLNNLFQICETNQPLHLLRLVSGRKKNLFILHTVSSMR